MVRSVTPPRVRHMHPGPVRSLFEELHALYRRAGEPSTRVLARSLGTGVLSHTTVHAVLNGRRVPRWGPLELVVGQLGGDIEQFRQLWLAARAAEDLPSTPARFQAAERVSLIGRQPQLDGVRRWVAELVAGRGRTVLIEGEPGIGKSALMRAAAQEAAEAGCQVFWAGCDELTQAFPLVPLLDTLDTGRTADGGRQPGIAKILRAESGPRNQIDVVAAATERLLALVERLCTAAPLVLVVDDLQWADPATVLTLGRLARLAQQLPLLVAGTTRSVPRRDDLNALRRGIDPADVVHLCRLSEADVAELLGNVMGGVPGDRLLRLAEGASGNPLYLRELADALIRGQALTVDEGRVEVSEVSAPDSLSAAIADRLQFLSAQARDVLRIAALLGLDVSVSELAVVSDHSVSDLVPILDEAILAGVLHDNGMELVFRHPLIRAALYEGMPLAVRGAWHRETARLLAEEGAQADRVGRQLLPALASQDGVGPVDEWMVRWLAGAGQELVSLAPHAAIPLLRWVLNGIPVGSTPHGVLSCRLADALFLVGDAAGAASVAEDALQHVTRSDLLVDLHWTLTQCRALAGRSEESLAVLADAMDLPDVGRRDRARLRVLAARAYRSLGRVDTAAQVADEALAEATAVGDRWAMSWALAIRTIAHGMRGEAAEAVPLLDRALAVAEGDPALADLRLVLQINRAAALGDLDRYDDAIAAAGQVRQLAEDAGNMVRLAQAQSVLGELLFDVGRWDEALAEVDLGTGGWEDPSVRCVAHGVAATIRFHRGDGEAKQHLVDVEPYVTRLGKRVAGPLVLARSLDREQADESAEALTVLLDGLSDTAEELEEAADLLADAMRLALRVGEVSATRAVRDHADGVAHASPAPHRQAVALQCHGLLDRDPDKLLEAAERYKVAGRMLPRAQAMEAAGVAFVASGDTPGAGTCFGTALSLYEELGAAWDIARVQPMLRRCGSRAG
jgi:tetratricopeptide (TPR) repeat protein